MRLTAPGIALPVAAAAPVSDRLAVGVRDSLTLGASAGQAIGRRDFAAAEADMRDSIAAALSDHPPGDALRGALQAFTREDKGSVVPAADRAKAALDLLSDDRAWGP